MTYVILGTGSDLPARVVTNDDIERTTRYDRERSGVGLHEWVMARAGVASRHRLAPGRGRPTWPCGAADRALDDADLAVGDIDLIVLGTFTSDARLPSTVSQLAARLRSSAKCLQLETACTGFIDALLVATSLMAGGGYRTALVVVTEAMSAVVDDRDFMYQSVFGDGAGAVVVRDLPGSARGIEGHVTHTDASVCEWTWAPGGGSLHPITAEVLADRSQYLRLDHRSIHGFAVDKMVDATHEVLNALDLTIDDVDWLVPHQTGATIIAEVVERLKFPPEQVVMCLEHTGNVSGASVVIALDEAQRAGRFADGDRIVVPVVGGGMAWGAISMVWRRPRSVA